jgi:hypothetical protein
MGAKTLADYDVNVFYETFTDPVSGEQFGADHLTITVHEYVDHGGVFATGEAFHRFILSAEETALIARWNPEDEFGADWWECAEDFLVSGYCPERVAVYLKGLVDV